MEEELVTSCGVAVVVVVVVVAVAVVVVVVVAVAVAVAVQDVADMRTVALDIEGSRTPVAFAPGLGHTYVRADHGFVMTRLTPENWIAGYGRLVVGTVFAACGQPPLCRVLLTHFVSLSDLDERRISRF